MSRLSILLADDHKMFSEGLRSLLQDEYQLTTVEDGQALVDVAGRLDPDVIIVDISMPVLNGFDAVRKLKKEGCSAKVIFLTMHADADLVAEALRCGASGYVLKQSVGEELIAAITQVLEGKVYLPQLMGNKLDQSLKHGPSHSLNLTPRQREVLRLVAQGRTMKEIAALLGISTRTAESHKYEMMEALGIHTTAELIQYAMKLGLIST
jgi:DNA-binding NarL/FixJ family response regulator